jgi:hypothetical protein
MDLDMRKALMRSAYDAGRLARDEHRISPGAHMLYERTLRITQHHTYIWAGLDKLASLLKVCEKTISRRFDELITAGLVWRERRLNRTWLTWIVPLAGPRSEQLPLVVPEDVRTDRTEMSSPHRQERSQDQTGGGGTASVSKIEDQPERANEGASSPTPPPLIDVPATPASEPLRAAIVELHAAGLVDPGTIAACALKPLEYIRGVVAYVRRLGKGPGLVAWFLRNDIPIPEAKGRSKGGGPAPERQAQDYLDALQEVADETNEASKYFKGDDACEVCGRAVCSCWNSDKSRTDDAEEVP